LIFTPDRGTIRRMTPSTKTTPESESPTPRTTLFTLPEALNFTDDDLIANRDGQISPRQRERLQANWRRMLFFGVIALIVIGFGAALLIFLGTQNNSLILTLIGFALTLLNAFIMGIGVQNRIRLDRDLREIERNGLLVTSGDVKHTLRVVSRAAAYILEIAGERVSVPKTVFFAFEEKGRYTLYRTPVSKTILSAEQI
jgi:hypothetical protein